MKDINGKEIFIGMTVKSTQQSGGLMSPAPSQTGVCELKEDRIVIRFRRSFHDWDSFILLEGKINEIINDTL